MIYITDSQQLTAHTSALAAGQIAVAPFAIRGGDENGLLHSLILSDEGGHKADLDIIFFSDEPANSQSLGAALDLSAADIELITAIESIVEADYKNVGTSKEVATKGNIGKHYKSKGEDSKIWCMVIARDTVTYTANQLSLKLGITGEGQF